MNVLVDTSVWINHLHRANNTLAELLLAGQVWVHPAVLGELACGQLRHRDEVLTHLKRLPRLREADSAATLDLIERHRLWGRGLSWVDVQFLASCLLDNTRLWTLDKNLHEGAKELGLEYS